MIADSGGFGGAWISLHDGYPGTNGANELATNQGSPFYGRLQANFGAASDGVRAITAALVFNVYTGKTVRWHGRWTAETSGSLLEVQPCGAQEKTFQVQGTDTILAPGHGYANSTGPAPSLVVFWGPGTPTGITEGQPYHVIDAATNTFRLSTSAGGSAVTGISTQPGLKTRMSKIVENAYSAQGVYTCNSFQSRIE